MTTLPIDNNIRRLRFEHGEMTQQALAEQVGVTRQTINAMSWASTRHRSRSRFGSQPRSTRRSRRCSSTAKVRQPSSDQAPLADRHWHGSVIVTLARVIFFLLRRSAEPSGTLAKGEPKAWLLGRLDGHLLSALSDLCPGVNRGDRQCQAVRGRGRRPVPPFLSQ